MDLVLDRVPAVLRATARDRRPPLPVSGPVLIGDIVDHRLGRPELLRRWEIDRDRINGGGPE